MKLGIDLVHILLDAPLGEVELFRNLAVTQPLRYQLHDLKFPRRQCVKDRRTGACRVSRPCRLAKLGDLCNQVSFPFLCQQGLQEIVVFHKRHYKSVRCGAREGLPQPCAGFLPLSQLRIGCRRLDADVQGYQCVMHSLAHRQQLCAVSDDLGISALSKIHLIFDHLHHGLARREHIDVREAVLGENLRDFVRFAPQGMVVGAGGAPEVDPRGVMIVQQVCVPLLKGVPLLHIGIQ